MNQLIKIIKNIQRSKIRSSIDKRLKEFKNNKDWFSELCFCLMTANWKAKEAIELQEALCKNGYCDFSEDRLKEFLKEKGHRFWPQRAERICLAKKYRGIKEILLEIDDKRAWLVKNIKGLGYKESSHFLRNVGFDDYAILDRHVINTLVDNDIIEPINSLTPKKYIEIERKLRQIANSLGMTQAELDLYIFYMKTGMVLK